MMYKITDKEIGQRLDMFMATSQSEHSRSQWQKRIDDGVVLVNGLVKSSHYKLKLDDEVMIVSLSSSAKARSDKKSKDEVVKTLPKIKVLFECNDYVVVDKPAGLVVHGTKTSTEVTLVDWLVANYPKIKKVGDDPLRPGIVHRLDKAVSGVMVVALNNKTFKSLKAQFQARTVEKKYQGLVYGQLIKDEGVIDFALERSSAGHKMAAKPKSQGGKEAITEFKVIQRLINYTLLELVIKTGRTHQIRAHMAAFNHQLVGDDWYGTVMTKSKNKKLALGRVFLVATNLAFDNLEGERVKYKITLPTGLKKVLEMLK